MTYSALIALRGILMSAIAVIDHALDDALDDRSELGPRQSKRRGLPRSKAKDRHGPSLDCRGPNGLDHRSLSEISESEKANKTNDSETSEHQSGERASDSEGVQGVLDRVSPSVGPSQSNANGPRQSNHLGPSQSKTIDHGDDFGPLGPTGLTLRIAMQDAWDGCRGLTTSGTNRSKIYALAPRVRTMAAERGLEPETFFRAAVARFKQHPNTKRRKLGLGIFLEEFDQWCDDEAPDQAPTAPRHRELPPPPPEAT